MALASGRCRYGFIFVCGGSGYPVALVVEQSLGFGQELGVYLAL